MNILIIGDDANLKESQQKFGETHFYTLKSNQFEAEKVLSEHDVIFDFCVDKDRSQMALYQKHSDVIAFLNTAKVSLAQLSAVVNNKIDSALFGFAGLPTFLNRPALETSLLMKDHTSKLEAICKRLNTEFQIVEDRVGLVTPRVICMIINEAYYTVEEGTASREDIDLAMKLGTNYPYGPFEWAQKIGVRNVYEVLSAVYEDTKDERYKICSLLTKE
jgi:3-hydroxybutyryl-CoA dehydrogenase